MDKEYAKHLMGIYKDKVLHERMKRRLEYFERVYKRDNDKRLFAELAFCICTPQTKARSGAAAIVDLYNHNLLFKGSADGAASQPVLNGYAPEDRHRYVPEGGDPFRGNH